METSEVSGLPAFQDKSTAFHDVLFSIWVDFTASKIKRMPRLAVNLSAYLIGSCVPLRRNLIVVRYGPISQRRSAHFAT